MEKRNTWLKSLAVNAIILITVMLLTHTVYETNDEFAIASRITDGYAEVNFVNYYLCYILVELQKLIPAVNMYVIAQIFGSFVSFTCILKIIMDESESRFIMIASAAVIALFSLDHYCTIQFTKTAALMIVAGTMLMMDSIAHKRNILYYLLSVLLLYTGVAFRIDGLIAAIGFAGLYLLKWLFDNRKTLVKDGYFSAGRIVSYIVLLGLIGGCYVFNNMSYKANIADDGLKAYKEYSILRSEVVDFPLYENYEQNAAAYDAIGISENDLNLIDHWYFDYDGAASAENLKKIIEVDQDAHNTSYSVTKAVKTFIKETIKSIKNMDFTGIHLITLTVMALWMFLSLRPKHWLYILMTGFLAACMYLALYYMQRPEYRALYIADIGAAMWLLYAMSQSFGKDLEKRRKATFAAMTAMALCLTIVAAMLIVPAHEELASVYAKAERKVMPQELADYLKAHDDAFFVFGTAEKKSSASYVTPLKAPDTYADRNIMGTGSWGTMSPYVLNKLDAYGLHNPIKDLIDNDHAYYVGNKRIKRLTEYYNKWYGGDGTTITMEKVDHVGGFDIWKVKSEP